MAGMGHLKRIWKDAFRVACAAQETCSSEMLGGQGEVEKSQSALARGHQLCTQLSIFEGSLAELFRFDVVNFEN